MVNNEAMVELINNVKLSLHTMMDAVKTIKENGPTESASLCAEHYRMLRDLHDEIEEVKKEAYHAVNHYAMVVLPELFESEGVKTLNLTSGFRVSIREVIRASVKADAKIDAYQWLYNNDLGDLITNTVNASSLSATARTLNEEGRELPADLFNVATLPQVSLTKTK